MRILVSLLLTLISLSAFCGNGIEMIMSHKQFKDNGVSIKAEKTSTIWISENMMKIASTDKNEPIMIFNSESDEIRVIMRDKKEYMKITKSELEKINAQLEESRQMMEQQLAQLPESQRAMVKEKMGNIFSDAVPEITYKKVQEDIEIGPYKTSKYEGFVKDSKTDEVYIASIDQFEIDTKYFQVYSQMMDFMRENLSTMMSSFSGESNSGSLSSSFPPLEEGMPVRSISFNGETINSQEELVKISEKEIPSEAFSVPAGYKEISLEKQMDPKK